jgi:Uma2 family endonuclease
MVAATLAAVTLEDATITGEELFALGDIGSVELIDGRIIPSSPTGGEHGRVESELAARLREFARQHKLGWVVAGEAGIYTRRNPDRVRGMDVAFVSYARLPRLPAGFLTVAPELVVEIISPTDRWSAMQTKIEEYLAIGVACVWVVDPAAHSVRVYRASARMTRLENGDILRGEGLLAGLEISLAELFGEIGDN